MKVTMKLEAEGYRNNLTLDMVEAVLAAGNEEFERYLWRWLRAEGLDIQHVKVEVEKVSE